MKAALAINYAQDDFDSNLDGIVDLIEQAADREVSLIVFPEMAVTGFITNDVPSHDFAIATTIPGPITDRLAMLAKNTLCGLQSDSLRRVSMYFMTQRYLGPAE